MKNTIMSVNSAVLALTGLLTLLTLTGLDSRKAEATSGASASSDKVAAFPARDERALTGSEFLLLTNEMGGAERERAILAEIRSGNVPSHMRILVPVQINYQEHSATIYVIPDYLAIGSDDDYVIIPMTPRTAMLIASEFDFTLPTRKLVDDIYQHSTVQLTPEPMHPGPGMTSNAYYQEHDYRIKLQLPQDGDAHPLIAGHKKDVVLTPRLIAQPQRVAIYGWHRPDGRPIQPLSLVHGSEYVDYSHGVRLVSRMAVIDGEEVDLAEIYADPQLNALVSDEGQVPLQSYYL